MKFLLPLTLLAGMSGQVQAAPQMETLTVTYRSPLDYALYQQTTETLSYFRIELAEDILSQSRASSRAMAKQYLPQGAATALNRNQAKFDWLAARRW